MTLGEMKIRVLELIDMQYNESGVEVERAEVAQLDARLPTILDIAQKELAQQKYIHKRFKLAHSNPENLIKNASGMLTHDGEDIAFAAPFARAYSFSVNNPAVVTVRVNTPDGPEDTIITHNGTPGEIVRYKGLIDLPTVTEGIELIFSGGNRYSILGPALYASAFAAAENVPEYGEYTRYEMPADFWMLEAVEYVPTEARAKGTPYMWENPRTLAIEYAAEGIYDIAYYAWPQTIAKDSTPLEYELEVEDDAQQVMLQFAAQMLLMPDEGNIAIADRFRREYLQRIANIIPAKTRPMVRFEGGYHGL